MYVETIHLFGDGQSGSATRSNTYQVQKIDLLFSGSAHSLGPVGGQVAEDGSLEKP